MVWVALSEPVLKVALLMRFQGVGGASRKVRICPGLAKDRVGDDFVQYK